jgi:hypothetical protein
VRGPGPGSGLPDPGYWAGMSDERARLEINWVQSMAGALAAVSSAVLLSTFGVAGTLIGAALGSLVITLGGAIYSFSIRATRERVAMAQTVASARIGLAQARVREASEGAAGSTPDAAEPVAEEVAEQVAEDLAEAEDDLDHAQAVLEDAGGEGVERPGWRTVLAGLPWKRITIGASVIFVIAMMAILTFELITGRAVSTFTGGTDSDRRTSIPGLGGGGGDREQAPTQDADPTDRAPEPTGVPPEDEPTEPVPSETPTETPPEAPTEVPTTEPTPTVEPSPGGASAPAESPSPSP